MMLAIGVVSKNKVSAERRVTEIKIDSYDYVSKFSEGLAEVKKYGKYGYIEKTARR